MNPEPQSDPADHETNGRAEAGLARTGDSSQACQMTDEIGGLKPLSAPPFAAHFSPPSEPIQRGASEPPAEPPPHGVPEAVRAGVPGAFAEEGATPLRAPCPEDGFTAALPAVLPPIVDLSALPSKSPSQIALAHRPWEQSTGPRSPEGKKRAALNGKLDSGSTCHVQACNSGRFCNCLHVSCK